MKKTTLAASFLILAACAVSTSAFAQNTPTKMSTGASIGFHAVANDDQGTHDVGDDHGGMPGIVPVTSAGVHATLSVNGRDRGLQEIDRRIDALNKLSARVDGMHHVSDSNKSSIRATVSSQIGILTTLRAKIVADTDDAMLKTDIESITKSYRIYMLVIPQGAILATGDRVDTTADLMSDFGTKLQTRIAAAQSAGTDTSAWQNTYADYTSKLADAQVQANAAVALTANLHPDNGDQAMMTSNKENMESAHDKVKVAIADLKAARKDADSIINALKGSANMNANAMTSTTITR